jgi:phage I-like protein
LIRQRNMVIAPYRLDRHSSKNRVLDPKEEAVKVREMLRKVVTALLRHRHTEDCQQEACERQADQTLHDLGARLHVLEWETYGPEAARRKRRATH